MRVRVRHVGVAGVQIDDFCERFHAARRDDEIDRGGRAHGAKDDRQAADDDVVRSHNRRSHPLLRAQPFPFPFPLPLPLGVVTFYHERHCAPVAPAAAGGGGGAVPVGVGVSSFRKREHDPGVDLVRPDEPKRGALGSALGTTEYARVVRVEEFAAAPEYRVRVPVPHVRDAIDGDDGKLVRRRERVQLRRDSGEVARAVGERRRGHFGVFEEDLGERVYDEQPERFRRAGFVGGGGGGGVDGCGQDFGEGEEERGDGFCGARLDVVEAAARPG